MTSEQALQLVDSAVSQIALNRQQHHQLTQAVSVLAQTIAPAPSETPEAEETPKPRRTRKKA
jgi:hypothetical protein